jgi:uncharacterized protein YsxB (DUF464 family)
MIRIRTEYSGSHLTGFRISGHAGSDVYGKDLVCAAVSAIAFGLLNALDELARVKDLKAENNLVSVHIEHPDETTDTIMNTGLIQFRTVAETNKDFVLIEKTEV